MAVSGCLRTTLQVGTADAVLAQYCTVRVYLVRAILVIGSAQAFCLEARYPVEGLSCLGGSTPVLQGGFPPSDGAGTSSNPLGLAKQAR